MRVFVLRKQDTGLEGLTEEIGQAAIEEAKRQAAEKLNEASDEIKAQLDALEITPDNFDEAAQTIEEVINSLSNLLGSIRALQEQLGQQPLRKQRGTVSLITDTDVDLVDKFMSTVAKIIKNYPPIDNDTADAAKAAIDEMRKILDQMEKNIAVIEMPPEE